MKVLVVYYSYSGNTKKVAETLSRHLKEKGEVGILELKALDETSNFFSQCSRAFKHKKAVIEETNFDLTHYDLVCLGSPVWAFGPAPAINTYLYKCTGLNNKEVLLFTTYGSGTGNTRCLNYMQKILTEKGINSFKRFSIQQGRVADEEFILKAVKEALRDGA